MSKRVSYAELEDCASVQWGLVTAAQASARGVTRVHLARLEADGWIRRVRHGVYALGGAPATWLEDVRAEWLATEPSKTIDERLRDPEQVVVADETAAAIHGFGDFGNNGIRLSSPSRIQSSRPFVHIANRQMSAKEWELVDGLPVTTPRRTLEDLARSGRWELQHIADAVDSALRAGVVARDDIARSKALMRAVPELAPPASHRSVLALLKQDAAARGVDPQAAQDGFFRFLFTSSLMEKGGDWVVKGGTGMMCRFSDARGTQDIDLFRKDSDDHVSSARELVELMDGAALGVYTFGCELDPRASREDANSSGIKVEVMTGGRLVRRFSIDVSDMIRLEHGPEVKTALRPDAAVIKGYPSRAVVRLYPAENQIADKRHST